tara:strand:- start:358 stop:606 length:249 start_codon:yes stop_codon:yes gene_type:complete
MSFETAAPIACADVDTVQRHPIRDQGSVKGIQMLPDGEERLGSLYGDGKVQASFRCLKADAQTSQIGGRKLHLGREGAIGRT